LTRRKKRREGGMLGVGLAKLGRYSFVPESCKDGAVPMAWNVACGSNCPALAKVSGEKQALRLRFASLRMTERAPGFAHLSIADGQSVFRRAYHPRSGTEPDLGHPQ